jgi:ABC-type glycerol-3-phosphate transport system substrate-binding protein
MEGHNMMSKGLKIFVAIATTVTIVTGSVTTYAKSKKDFVVVDTSTPLDVTYTNEMIGNNYTMASKKYTTQPYNGDPVEVVIPNAYIGNKEKITLLNYDYKNEVLDLKIEDIATVVINAPQAGRYYLSFDYLTYTDSIIPVEFVLSLNGEVPFYEARRATLESTWTDKNEKSHDRYGNEIVTVPNKLIQWENKFFMDASYRNSKPFEIELKEGANELKIDVTEGSFLLGNLYLMGEEIIPEYEKAVAMDGTINITLEGEDMDFRNDSSIRATNEYDTFLTPYSTTSKIMNVVDSASFKDAGQRVTYKFKVDNAGYYNIGFAYRQSDKADFPVLGDIRIDDEIPSTLMKAYPFPYTKDYTNLVLKDKDNDKVAVYLTEGEHEISLTINMDNIRHVLEAVDRIMSEVNDLALEITKVAGKNKDKYRDLDIVRYIPDVEERLINWADQLDTLQESVKIFNPNVKKIAAFSSLNVASSRLRSLAKEPNRLPYRIDELAQSTNSVIQYLANLIDILNKNAIAIDKVYLFQNDAKLPKGEGFFKSTSLNIKRFFNSFNNQAYSTSNTNSEHLQVWVNRSRQHVEILQKLIDESFTPESGIKVDVSIMPDQNKLILANASSDAPDVAASINYAIPFELGIRGAIKDITEFDDYSEVLSRTVDGLHIPATIGDGIYAVPETINFWVLYYRSDILDKLGLEVPNTMEEVKKMLPELQMRGLNFYYPTAGMIALKTFHGTTPLLFQYGATLYDKTAGNTAINSDNAIKGLTELTELFTIYNLPADVPSFYQHFRNGDIPIGIAEYNMYNLLTNAAPEIANAWDIALVPGIEGEDGEIKRYTSGGAESCVIFKSTTERENMAWEYLKWWTSKETQVEYGQTLQTTYGSEYIWNSANTEAFTELPWKSDDKKVIMDQTEWMLEAPRILGTYMLEREISDTYNKVVVWGKDLRITVDSSIKRVNRETRRKLTEFGYLSQDGEVLKEYIVPTIDIVRDILYGDE